MTIQIQKNYSYITFYLNNIVNNIIVSLVSSTKLPIDELASINTKLTGFIVPVPQMYSNQQMFYLP